MVRVKSSNADIPSSGRRSDEKPGPSKKERSSASLSRDGQLRNLPRRNASNDAGQSSSAPRGGLPSGTSPSADRATPATSLLGRAAEVAGGALHLSWKTYVGVAAVAAGYGAFKHAGTAQPRSSGSGPLVDVPTLHQAKAEVMTRHAAFIPADSACHGVEPQVTSNLPKDYRGLVRRHKAEPTSLSVREGLPREVGIHTARHEFLHCFSHPNFVKGLAGSPHQNLIDEALTEYFADQFPDHPNTMTVADLPLSNGKTGVAAAAELERVVGKKTLQRAYFQGEPRALAKVIDALVDIFPKETTPMAWISIMRFDQQPAKQALAECFIGAALLYTDRLPQEEGRLVVPGHFLKLRHFSDITSSQAASLKKQAEAAQARHGRIFDQAFCNFEPARQRAAMDKIAQELQAKWRPVLA